MRQSNGFRILATATIAVCRSHRAQQFSLLRTIMQMSWTSESRQFTRQYYKWLADINRYEAENGHGSITEHVKIATVVNNLKGNIAENLMMRINQMTTFDDVHQWTSNYFNSTYTGTEDSHKGQVGGVSNYDNENDNEEYNAEEYDESWDYDNNDPLTVAFFRGKAKGQKKGKGKGKKGDNKGKDSRTVTCYTCGKQGHTSTFCYYNKGKSGKGQSKGQPQSNPYYYQQPGKGYHTTPYQQQYYSQPSMPQHPPSTSPPTKGYSKGFGKPWNKGGKKGQSVPVHQINDNEYYYEDGSYTWGNCWNQEWQLSDGNQQWGAQEVGQVLQQHPSEDNSASTLPMMRSLYEIGSLTAQ
eukprot:91536-Amphidinium_carterae.1